MAELTNIEWCDHTFNPWTGCEAISPGCKGCYAAGWAKRAGRDFAERRRTKTWRDPVKWNERHAEFFEAHGRRQRVFCASLADVFDNQVPEAWRDELIGLIVDTPHLHWLLLTKRIGNVPKMLKPEAWEHLQHVWLGATVVDQAEAERDVPKLLQVPARVRFLSIEPMLGPISFDGLFASARVNDGTNALEALDWVICGGESGPGARPMHPEWARSLRDQCQAAGVPFLFKQWGEWCPRGPESLGYTSVDDVPRVRMTDRGHDGQDLASEGGNDVWMNRAGKKRAGRFLDGRLHDEWPVT